MRIHPRIAQQGIGEDRAQEVMSRVLARIIPFPSRSSYAAIAMLDWDHRLPSKAFTLRLHLCDDARSVDRVEAQLDEIGMIVKRRDLFPEFDVPDFGGVEGDETYDVDLNADLGIEAMRLTSRWRRSLKDNDRVRAVELVRRSTEFQEKERTTERDEALGELEAVAWAAPCESGLTQWVLDVWWLTTFDGMVGRGFSFLVDMSPLAAKQIVTVRDFTVRAG